MDLAHSPRSRLVEMLRHSAWVETRRMGFGITESPKPPRAVLIVGLPLLDASPAETALRAGADALLFEALVRTADAREQLAQTVRNLGDAPSGLVLGEGTALDSLPPLGRDGLDFVVARSEDVPPSFLGVEAGKGVVVDHDLPPSLVRSVNDLPLDFVVLGTISAEQPVALTLRQMLSLRLLAEGLRKPVVLASSYLRGPDDLTYFEHVGLDGLVPDVEPASRSSHDLESLIGQYRKALDSLGGRLLSRRRAEVIPTLPRVTPAPVRETEPGEPDEQRSGSWCR